jgi:hypothetical protein
MVQSESQGLFPNSRAYTDILELGVTFDLATDLLHIDGQSDMLYKDYLAYCYANFHEASELDSLNMRVTVSCATKSPTTALLTISAGSVTEIYGAGITQSYYAFGNLQKQTIIRSSHRPIAHVGGVEMPVAFLPDIPTEFVNEIPMTQAEYDALENPVGSGLYPTLAGKEVIITDRYKDNAVIVDATPDDSKKITIINAQSVPATISENGFVHVRAYINVGSQAALLRVDGVDYHIGADSNLGLTCTLFRKVRKGQVVSVESSSGALGTIIVSFIPNKYAIVPTPNLNVEIGTDYSTTEQPVLIKDSVTGEIRQKLDVDGSPIWEQTFTGNIGTLAANTNKIIALMDGVKNVITSSGYANIFADGYELNCPGYATNESAIAFGGLVNITKGGTNNWIRLNYANSVATVAGKDVYRVTVQYTKV